METRNVNFSFGHMQAMWRRDCMPACVKDNRARSGGTVIEFNHEKKYIIVCAPCENTKVTSHLDLDAGKVEKAWILCQGQPLRTAVIRFITGRIGAILKSAFKMVSFWSFCPIRP